MTPKNPKLPSSFRIEGRVPIYQVAVFYNEAGNVSIDTDSDCHNCGKSPQRVVIHPNQLISLIKALQRLGKFYGVVENDALPITETENEDDDG